MSTNTTARFLWLSIQHWRIKALDCLYQLNDLFSHFSLLLFETLADTVTTLPSNMTAKNKKQRNAAAKKTAEGSNSKISVPDKDKYVLALEHLPPLPLVFAILFCSGISCLFGIRDTLATGKNILGEIDYSYLVSSQC